MAELVGKVLSGLDLDRLEELNLDFKDFSFLWKTGTG